MSRVSKTVNPEEYTAEDTIEIEQILLDFDFVSSMNLDQATNQPINHSVNKADKPYTISLFQPFAKFPYICSLMQLATCVSSMILYLPFLVSPLLSFVLHLCNIQSRLHCCCTATCNS